jgi:hypothetical protein
MNAPIIDTAVLEQEEAGPAQPKPAAKKQPAAAGTADGKKPEARGLLAADGAHTSRHRHYDRRWREERLGRYRRYTTGLVQLPAVLPSMHFGHCALLSLLHLLPLSLVLTA